jgi:hypothetical protein
LSEIKLTRDLNIEEKPSGESARILHWLIVEAELLKLLKNGQFPDETVRKKSDKFTM